MWRRLLARVHPDAGGDDELFVWAKSLEELVRAKAQDVPAPPLGGTLQRKGRIPFDPHTDFDRISERALQFAPRAFGYGDVLRLMRGAKRTGTAKDRRGATYEQLARIAYLLGIDKHERNARKMWYRIARDVMLSEAHADHIIGSLEDRYCIVITQAVVVGVQVPAHFLYQLPKNDAAVFWYPGEGGLGFRSVGDLDHVQRHSSDLLRESSVPTVTSLTVCGKLGKAESL
jgi:hypothetical protein